MVFKYGCCHNAHMSSARALILVACLLLAPLAAAKSQPAVLFLADADAPVGQGNLSADVPDGNVSSVRVVVPAAAEELLLMFAAQEPGGTRLYGPSWVAFWPDQAMAENGSTLRATLRLDGEVIAEGSVPAHFDPANIPDPLAFIPPDPTDPEGAAFHIVAQALPLVYTPPKLVYFGFLDVDVPENATLAVTFELVPAGPVPVGSVALKYNSIPTPSYLYVPWWVPDLPRETGTQGPLPSPTPTATQSPSGTDTGSGETGKDSPGLSLLVSLVALGLLALKRRW